MTPLTETEIRQQLTGLAGWKLEGSAIRRDFKFDSFPAAIRFVNRIADLAEEADHHPDIDIRFDRVRLVLTTHSAGGLTRRDFALAGRIDGLG